MALTLDDGAVVVGEAFARWDQRLWWDAADRDWVAVFDPAGWDTVPDDHSVELIPLDRVAAQADVPLDVGTASWADTLYDRGVTIDANPLPQRAFVIMGNEGYHLEEDGYGDFAWDLVVTDDTGARYTGLGATVDDFLVWEQPVTLPTDGIVVEVVRDAPDHPVGSYPPGAVNNLVGVWLGGQVYLYLLHFRQDSIPLDIQPGDALRAGTFLGLVGNSGVTLEPHLHLTLMYYDLAPLAPEPARTWSVPGEWTDLWVAEGPTEAGELRARASPTTGQWIHDGSSVH